MKIEFFPRDNKMRQSYNHIRAYAMFITQPNKAFSAKVELTGYYLRNLVFTTINNNKYTLSLFYNFIILVVVYDSVIVLIPVNI